MISRFVIDCLQYVRWSEKAFRKMREGGLAAVGFDTEEVARLTGGNRLRFFDQPFEPAR